MLRKGRVLNHKSIFLTILVIILFCSWPSVTEAAIGATITGIGTPETVLQMGETESRKAFTAEKGTITWTSDNAEVATVDAVSGLVTAVAQGTANISYTSSSGNTNSVAVTVYEAAIISNLMLLEGKVARVTDPVVILSGMPVLGENSKRIFSTDGNIDYGVREPLIRVYPFEERTHWVAYKTRNNLTFKIENKGEISFTVYPEEQAVSIVNPVLPAGIAVQVGEGNVKLLGEIDPAEGETQTWFSSDPAKATVAGKVVTPIAAGTTIISYKNTNNTTNQVTKEGSITITVEAAAAIANLTLPEGKAVQLDEGNVVLSGMLPCADNSVQRSYTQNNPNMSFSSRETYIIVEPFVNGDFIIGYRNWNKKTFKIEGKGEIAFTVYLPAKIVNPVLPVGTAVQVGAGAVTLTDYAAADAGQAQTWFSSDETKATVVEGIITPVTAGTVTISYHNKDDVTNALITKGVLEVEVLAAAMPEENKDADTSSATSGEATPLETLTSAAPLAATPLETLTSAAPLAATGSLTGGANADPGYESDDLARDTVKLSLAVGSKTASVNEVPTTIDSEPVIVNDRVMVPLRFIGEALNAIFDWDSETRTVSMKSGSKELSLVIDKIGPGLDVPATIMKGRTMVPIRYISENLGAKVTWFPESRTVSVLK